MIYWRYFTLLCHDSTLALENPQLNVANSAICLYLQNARKLNLAMSMEITATYRTP